MSLMLHEMLLSGRGGDVIYTERSTGNGTTGAAYVGNTIPAAVQAGDIMTAFSLSINLGGMTVPIEYPVEAGWTKIATHTSPLLTNFGTRVTMYYKIATALDAGSVVFARPAVTSLTHRCRLTTWRLPYPITAVTGSGSAATFINSPGSPASITIPASTLEPLVVGDGYYFTVPAGTNFINPTPTDPAFYTTALTPGTGSVFKFERSPTYDIVQTPGNGNTGSPTTTMNSAVWVSVA